MDALQVPDDLVAAWRVQGLRGDRSFAVAMAEIARTRADAILHIHSDSRSAQATLGDVFEEGRRVAGALWSLGLRPGDVVAMQLPNCLENAVLSQAAAAIGCVILPIVHIFGPAELEQVLTDSHARVLVVPDRWRSIDFGERLARLPRLPALAHRIVVGDGALAGAMAWRDLPRCPAPVVDVDPDAEALRLYTSGTTAQPKGVRHSSNSFIAEMTSRRQGADALRTWLSPWPSGHVAGTIAVMSHSLLGQPMVLMDAWDAAAAAMLIECFAVEQTSGTPFHLAGLMEAAARDARDVSSLRQFIIGATTVPPALVAASEAAGIRCCRCYGSTEMPTFSQCLPEDPLDKRLSVDGRPNPGCEARIVDDEGRDTLRGAEGELAVRGPERFMGYTDPALNAASFLPGGWFLTGDIARIDADGFIAITDRKKDIIIRGGENISSREIEELMLRIPGVREAAAIACPDERLGETVCAVVILEPGRTLSVAEVDAAFRAIGVARQKSPQRIEVVDDFPRTPTGKVQKAELRQRFGFDRR